MIQKDFYKEASIAFTGHREIPSEQQSEVRERLKQAVILCFTSRENTAVSVAWHWALT